MVEVTSSHIMRCEYLNTYQCLELHEQVDLKNKLKLRLHNEVKLYVGMSWVVCELTNC